MLLRFIFFITFSFQLSLHANLFDTLKTVKSENRIKVASDIFYKKVFKLDSTIAFKELDYLLAFSKSKKDTVLEVLAFEAKGYYYFNRIPEKSNIGIEYHIKAIELANKAGLNEDEANLLNRLGLFLFLNKDINKGFEYLLRSDRMMQNVGYSNIYNVYYSLYNLALAYSEFKNYNKAISYLEKALEYSNNDSIAKIKLSNDLGLLYLNREMFNEAHVHFDNAYKIANALNDSFFIGLVSGNIGNIYYEFGKIDTASFLLEQDCKISLKFENWRSACLAQLLLIKIDIEKNNLQSAVLRMKNVKKLMALLTLKSGDRLVDFFDSKIWLDYYKEQASINYHLKNYADAYLYLDSFTIMNDSITKINDTQILLNLETQILTEKHLNDKELLKKDEIIKENDRLYQNKIRNIVTAILLILMTYIIYRFINYKKIKNKENLMLINKNKKVNSKLIESRNRLKILIKKIKDNNNLIAQLKDEIEMFHINENPERQKEREEKLQLLKNSKIYTEEDWRTFKLIYNEAYNGFFDRLNKRFPELTHADERLLALIKLGNNNNEIASILGISSESVRKTNFRLRKKLSIESNADLTQFANSI
jgi:tetratricopeptide (TPR) repeat protein